MLLFLEEVTFFCPEKGISDMYIIQPRCAGVIIFNANPYSWALFTISTAAADVLKQNLAANVLRNTDPF